MKTKQLFLTILSCLLGLTSAQSLIATTQSEKESEFISSHLLPDGQLKTVLDAAFASTRRPKKAFKNAGFTYLKKDHTYVMADPAVPDLLIKYMPSNSKKMGLFTTNRNVGRVTFADQIAHLIDKYHMEQVVVPQKWLYHIPGAKQDLSDANYLVIAQRLDILDDDANTLQWRGINVDQEDEVRTIIKEIGFHDVRPENLCFTTDRKIAFIDTEPRWTPLLRNGIFRSIRKKLLGNKGEERFNELLEQMSREADEFYAAEIEQLSTHSYSEGVLDVANICEAALCDDEGDIEPTDEAFDAFCEQILTRGGGDLTLFERIDDAIEWEATTPASLDLDKDEQLTPAGNEVDLPPPASVIVLEYREPAILQPVGYDLFTSGTQEFSMMHSDCISL